MFQCSSVFLFYLDPIFLPLARKLRILIVLLFSHHSSVFLSHILCHHSIVVFLTLTFCWLCETESALFFTRFSLHVISHCEAVISTLFTFSLNASVWTSWSYCAGYNMMAVWIYYIVVTLAFIVGCFFIFNFLCFLHCHFYSCFLGLKAFCYVMCA